MQFLHKAYKGEDLVEKFMYIEYRGIPGYPLYRVGNDGSFWSKNYPRKNKGAVDCEWRQMHPSKNSTGHMVARIRVNKEKKSIYVHRAVAMAFLGPVPKGKEVCHNDGNPANNVPENLRFDTRWGNLNDRRKHGTMNCGIRQGHAKLDDAKILRIFEMAADGVPICDIANTFGVHYGTILPAVKRMTWRHVEIPEQLIATAQAKLPKRGKRRQSGTTSISTPLSHTSK